MLVDCPLNHRAFPSDIYKLGGIARLAGVDIEDCLPHSINDHPWIGQFVTFPRFSDHGFRRGRIDRCIVHPRGKLMFDVHFPNPVPLLHKSTDWEVVTSYKYAYVQDLRFYGNELFELVNEKSAVCAGAGTP